jgi:hypothetical protein
MPVASVIAVTNPAYAMGAAGTPLPTRDGRVTKAIVALAKTHGAAGAVSFQKRTSVDGRNHAIGAVGTRPSSRAISGAREAAPRIGIVSMR